MAFVANYENSPYFLTKLMIPQVSSYQDEPKSYIYGRAPALYTFIHYELFSRLEKIDEKMLWRDKELQKVWGKCNKFNAKADYQNLLNSAKEAQAPSCGPYFKRRLLGAIHYELLRNTCHLLNLSLDR